MAKLTLNDITSGYSTAARLNANNDATVAAMENTLSLDGTAPNEMQADFDMGGNRIVNLGAPVNDTDAVRVIDIETGTVTVSPTVAWADILTVPTVLETFGDLTDPGADRLVFWDDSAGATVFLTLGTNLSITGTTLNASASGSTAWGDLTSVPAYVDSLGDLADPGADRIIFWDDSAGGLRHLTASTGLSITTTSLSVSILGLQTLSDPNADRIFFWDDSAGSSAFLTLGTGLAISGTTIAVSTALQSFSALTDPNADRIIFWDDSAGAYANLTVSTGLSLSGTTLTTTPQIAEGANARMGQSTLVGGTVTVANTSVTANSRIFLTSNVDGGTPGWLRVSARVAATSFTITSSSGTDTSSVAWMIVEPA